MYPNKQTQALLRKTNAHDTAENLAAAAAVYGGLLVCRPIKVTGLYFYITTTVDADNVVPVVEVNRRPTYNSGSGEEVMATITFADGDAAGKVAYQQIEPVLCYPGDEISFEHVTQATDSGTAAGAGFYGIDYELVAEATGNCGDWISR